jgi:hypothetical protein
LISTFHIVVAMKPLEGNFTQNALKYGVAGINVDGTRIDAFDGKSARIGHSGKESHCNIFGPKRMHAEPDGKGRYPSNVILEDNEKVKGLFPETKSNDPGITHVKANGWGYSTERRNTGYAGDSGSASRFFKQVKEE